MQTLKAKSLKVSANLELWICTSIRNSNFKLLNQKLIESSQTSFTMRIFRHRSTRTFRGKTSINFSQLNKTSWILSFNKRSFSNFKVLSSDSHRCLLIEQAHCLRHFVSQTKTFLNYKF